jgi:hypothetical protein
MKRLAVLVLACAAALSFPAAASGRDAVRIVARIDGHGLASSSVTHPTKLNPTKPISLDLTVYNTGTQPVSVRSLRLDGRVIGLTFFAYNTATRFVVPAGAIQRRTISVDLLDLEHQATGLLPASVRLLDSREHTIASRSFIADVRGSARSVYAVFGMALVVLTVVLFVGTLLSLARHKLPANRFLRGARFAAPGVGLAFVAIFTFSAFRLWVPQAGVWELTVVLVGGAFFVLGYLSPTPDIPDYEQIGVLGYEDYGGYQEQPAIRG